MPSAKEQLLGRGLRAKKSWGQNFLHDKGVLAAIVSADASEGPAIELGAGLGALTEALLSKGRKVVAIERDRELVPALEAMAALTDGRLDVVAADAQRLDYGEWRRSLAGPLHVFGNLPYQISSRILVSLADAGEHIAQATLLVQKEVAERLVAGPPGRVYGLLSVLVQRRFAAQMLQVVPPGAFWPPPKVDSAIVRLTPLAALPFANAEQEAWLTQAARAAFAARRKTLRNSVQAALQRDAHQVHAAIEAAGLSPTARAETLGVSDFARLGVALFDPRQKERAHASPR